jgi:hypothetical protein
MKPIFRSITALGIATLLAGVSATVRAEPATKTIPLKTGENLAAPKINKLNQLKFPVTANSGTNAESPIPVKPGEGITLNRPNYQIVVYLGPNDLRGLSSTAGQGDGHFEFRINFVPR